MWMTEAQFRETDDGYIYFRRGLVGRRSYKISDEKKAELANFLNRVNLSFVAFVILIIGYLIATFVGLPSYLSLPFLPLPLLGVLFALGLIWAVYIEFRIKNILGNAEHSADRLTFSDMQSARARFISSSTVHLLLAAILALTAFGGWLTYEFYRDDYRPGFWAGLFWIFGCLFSLIVTIDVMRLKRAQSNQPNG
jgi:formate-dependent nitrite reductase membrane component NrfD